MGKSFGSQGIKFNIFQEWTKNPSTSVHFRVSICKQKTPYLLGKGGNVGGRRFEKRLRNHLMSRWTARLCWFP